ncbi:hypothetical protein G6L14_02000 [Agrobacterium vitis]|uniref:hypothetical protein n=1 Tax=Agrobacterium vitis TaxID=373 RepID=UPI001571D5A0|nr:hypothetical protein [Agrobacterium vitis]NSY10788.1 hypothetical protein [Agrobacterium vitis]
MKLDRPGYQYRAKLDGTHIHYWNPKRAVKGAPAYLSMVRLADDATDIDIAAECTRLTNQLRDDLRCHGSIPEYDGTIKSLIEQYRYDKTSTLHSVKHSTRIRDYEPSLRVLEKNVGARRIDMLKASDFRKWYAEWKKKGHRRASGAVKLLRIIMSYGAGERLHGCIQARATLADMLFDLPQPRTVAMTYEQCLLIVQKSAEMKCPSIGFVEALKFESALRRIDVIGEWTPPTDGGQFRWTGPVIGTNLSKDKILTLKTSKTGAAVARDLLAMPLVTEALKAYTIPEIGPIVIDEDTGKPYRDNHYSTKFRDVRNAAGVSSNVWSMDTRAGAVSETIEATGSIEAAQNLATHSTAKMTKRYARGDGLESSRKIAAARSEQRK